MTTLNVGFVIFPNLTQLDFAGPLEVLNRLPESKIHIIAKSLDPVPSDCGLSVLPTETFKDCCQLDLICVPGGGGVVAVMTDRETVDFVPQAGGWRSIHHLGLHRRVCAWGSRTTQGASSDDPLGLQGSADAGGCDF
jgi:transcriptional regulator GlxA family with amidase domain